MGRITDLIKDGTVNCSLAEFVRRFMDYKFLSESESVDYLDHVVSPMIDPTMAKPIGLDRNWADSLPKEPGVYVVFEASKLVYVGESGSLKERMVDLLDSRHHQLRRNIGEELYSDEKGFARANSKTEFPRTFEDRLERYIKTKLKLAAFPVYLGRSEIEEYIINKWGPIYNRKGRRGLVPIAEQHPRYSRRDRQ